MDFVQSLEAERVKVADTAYRELEIDGELYSFRELEIEVLKKSLLVQCGTKL